MFLDALTKVTPYNNKDDKLVNVFVETPKGSRQKYDLDHGIGLMTWSLELSAGLNFPFSFGFVPNKKAEDGDALDIILLLDADIHGLNDLRDELKCDIQQFFGSYHRMIERGFESLGFKGADTAYQLLDESIANAK